MKILKINYNIYISCDKITDQGIGKLSDSIAKLNQLTSLSLDISG